MAKDVVDQIDEMVAHAVENGIALDDILSPSQSDDYRRYVSSKYKVLTLEKQIGGDGPSLKM